MTDEKMLEDAKKLVDEFNELNIVKEIRKLNEAIKNDEKLKALKEESKKLRKGLGSIEGEKAQLFVIEKIRSLEDEYDTDPKVVNYKNLRDELKIITDKITNILK